MPRLYNIDHDFNVRNPRYRPDHYFSSALYGRQSVGSDSFWSYNLEDDFSAQAYMHYDVFDNFQSRSQKAITDVNRFWIDLRKAVEREYQGDVFYQYAMKDYHWWWNKDATSYNKEKIKIKHGYWTFYFENPEDHLMFVLNYKEHLSERRYRFHPNFGVSCMDKRFDVPDDEHLEDIYGYTF